MSGGMSHIFTTAFADISPTARALCVVRSGAGEAEEKRPGSSNGPPPLWKQWGRFESVGAVEYSSGRGGARARFGAPVAGVLVLVFKPPGAARVDQNGAHG